MSFFLRLVTKLPIPTEARLAWQRKLLDRAYSKDISDARRLKDKDKVESLELDYRLEIDLHDEDEDSYLTKKLLAKARDFVCQFLIDTTMTRPNPNIGTKVNILADGI
jgi:hypothetical protein